MTFMSKLAAQLSPPGDNAPGPGAPDDDDAAELYEEETGELYPPNAGQPAQWSRQDPLETADQAGRNLPGLAPLGYVPQVEKVDGGPFPMRPVAAAGWMADELAVPADRSLQVAGEDPDRRSITLLNTGTVPVRVARGQFTATDGRGSFPIAVGASIDLDTSQPVWAQAVGATGLLGLVITTR